MLRNKNKHGLPYPNTLPRFRDAPVQESPVFSPNPAHFSTMMQLSWGVGHYPPGGVNEKGEHVVNPKVPRSAVLTNIESKERGQNHHTEEEEVHEEDAKKRLPDPPLLPVVV